MLYTGGMHDAMCMYVDVGVYMNASECACVNVDGGAGVYGDLYIC